MKQHNSLVKIGAGRVRGCLQAKPIGVLRKSLLIGVVTLALLPTLCSRSVQAATKTWTGNAGNTFWNDAGNWSGGVPGSGDEALFDSGANPANINVSIDIAVIQISAGYSGTITQASGVTVTLSGLTITCDPVVGAAFLSICQHNGTFTGTNASLLNFNGGFTLMGGTFTAGPGNFSSAPFRSFDIKGGVFNSASGTTTINVDNGTFLQSGGIFNGNGTTDFNCATFRVSGGTFNATDGNTIIRRNFDHVGGTFDPHNGTVILTSTQGGGFTTGGTQTFNNLTLNYTGTNHDLSNATVVVTGLLRLMSGFPNTGTLQPLGDVLVDSTFGPGGDLPSGTPPNITFAGDATAGKVNQVFTNNGGVNLNGTWTINKAAGRVTLASDLNLLSGGALNITSGILDQGTSFNLAANTITIGSAGGTVGRLTNQGTGDLTLGASLTVNTGSTISLNGGGGNCGDADSILIRSTVDGVARTWSGAGNFFLTDVDVKDQSAANPPGSITVFNGTDQPPGGPSSNTNFVFVSGCNPTASAGTVSGVIVDDSGNPVAGVVVRLSGTQNRRLISDAQGFYRFDNVESNGFYTVTPSRVNFSFSPAQRSFSQLGNQTGAVFTALPNGGNLNPLDTPEYFVRQHYLDFLGREPDEAGLNFWSHNLEKCGADLNCREVAGIDTSAAFFLSIEFQRSGFLLYRVYQTAFGDMPGAPVPISLAAFNPDAETIRHGVVVNQAGWDQVLEQNTSAFLNDFVQRPRFIAAYPTAMTPAEFVTSLFENAGVTPSETERNAAIREFGSATDSSETAARARALRRVAEHPALARQEFDQAFVLMQYFGYLQRDPNSSPDVNFDGYDFWLGKLNEFNGNYVEAEMVKAFITSGEYRQRFVQ